MMRLTFMALLLHLPTSGQSVVVLDDLFSPSDLAAMHTAAVSNERKYMMEYDVPDSPPSGEASHLEPWSSVVKTIWDRLQPHAEELLSSVNVSVATHPASERWHIYRAYINRFRDTDRPIPHRDWQQSRPHGKEPRDNITREGLQHLYLIESAEYHLA